MIALVLAAGYATRMYPLTENFPKPLLPVGGVSILERLVLDMDGIPCVSGHVVVGNHRFAAHFSDWAQRSAAKKPIRVLDDGSTCNENRLGAVRDIQFAIEALGLDDDLLVVAGDNLLDFSLGAFVDQFISHGLSSVMCYHEPDARVLRRCGVLRLDENFRLLDMQEKPEVPPSQWAVPPFYLYARRDLPLIRQAISAGAGTDAPGSLPAYLCHRTPMRAFLMPGRRIDVGDLQSYERLRDGAS